jgi:hypothetical protein
MPPPPPSTTNHTNTDFWTTRCTNCPSALDELNDLASDERYENVKFASICCDSCDGAREIIEKDDSPRWEKLEHFFMDTEHKEEAKRVLGFGRVPFYVVLNEEGDIVQMGSKKNIDFDNLPGMVQQRTTDDDLAGEEKKDDDDGGFQIFDLDF